MKAMISMQLEYLPKLRTNQEWGGGTPPMGVPCLEEWFDKQWRSKDILNFTVYY